MSRRVIAIIPARIDSSRFSAKMIADETGRPLIQYAWENALAATAVTEAYIATDSKDIAERCSAFGAEVIMTGSHPNGTSRIAEAMHSLDCDIVVNMQGDEPELNPIVIDKTIGSLANASMATAVCPLQDEELNNTNVVKAIVDGDKAVDFTRDAICGSLRHIGLYVYKPVFLQTYVQMQPTQNEIARRLEQMRALDNGFSISVAHVDPQPSGIDTKEQYDEFVTRMRFGTTK